MGSEGGVDRSGGSENESSSQQQVAGEHALLALGSYLRYPPDTRSVVDDVHLTSIEPHSRMREENRCTTSPSHHEFLDSSILDAA